MNGFEPERRILIATDGSDAAQAACVEGVRLASSLGATVIFVTVAPEPLPVLGDPYYQQAVVNELRQAREAAAAAIPVAEERRVPCEIEVLEGPPARRILALSRDRDVELIVVGSRGRGALKSALLGSVSSEVVNHADRPVLVIPSRDTVDGPARLRAAI